jgi:two-component system response regulator YesN
MYKVLIVDDDKAVRYMLKRFKKWSFYGFAIEDEACDGKEALKKLSANQFDLIITDIKMPGMNGLEFLSELKLRKWDICLILLSTHSDFEYAKQGIRLGVFDYMTKPLDDYVLSEALERTKKHLEEKEFRKTRFEEEKKLVEESLTHYYPKNQEKKLADLLLIGNSMALDAADNAFSEIAELVQQDLSKIGMLLETLLLNLSAEVYTAFPWLENIERLTFEGDMTQANSMIEIKLKFLSHINSILKIIRKYELNHADSVVKRTCQYVMKHVEEDIKLEIVANEVHISKDYIGKLFKQKTGCNFTDYVTKVKMEHAKYLLGTGEYKNYEVSEKLGYSSPDYFCRLFKSYTGHTPLEFRKLGT